MEVFMTGVFLYEGLRPWCTIEEYYTTPNVLFMAYREYITLLTAYNVPMVL